MICLLLIYILILFKSLSDFNCVSAHSYLLCLRAVFWVFWDTGWKILSSRAFLIKKINAFNWPIEWGLKFIIIIFFFFAMGERLPFIIIYLFFFLFFFFLSWVIDYLCIYNIISWGLLLFGGLRQPPKLPIWSNRPWP